MQKWKNHSKTGVFTVFFISVLNLYLEKTEKKMVVYSQIKDIYVSRYPPPAPPSPSVTVPYFRKHEKHSQYSMYTLKGWCAKLYEHDDYNGWEQIVHDTSF